MERVIIIGAGPAGVAAAIQLCRYGIEPLVLEKGAIGGLLKNANLVENYPGFPDGVPGTAMVALIDEHSKKIGVQITKAHVTSLDYTENAFQIETNSRSYQSRRVVIASGTRARRFTDFPIPTELSGRVFYEVHHLLGKSGKKVAIVGAGDAAFDYALNLSASNNEVVVLNRGNTIKCLPLLQERAKKMGRISYREHTTIRAAGSTTEGKILIKCDSTDGQSSFIVDYLIGAIGRDPQLNFVSEYVFSIADRLEQAGLLYFIGDVKNKLYRQTSIAVGDGVLAAMQIYKNEVESKL